MFRWDNWILWSLLGAGIFVLGVCGLAAVGSSGEADIRIDPLKAPNPRLFADASGGIEQFVGGETMPKGYYEFDCSFAGNVSVQMGRAPYTVSMKSGDQQRYISDGDLVTVGMCKVYGPR